MIDPKIFADISEKVGNALPPGLKHMREELDKNLKAALQASFAKLNLVTREEFDLQVKLLHKCREQLAELEKRLEKIQTK